MSKKVEASELETQIFALLEQGELSQNGVVELLNTLMQSVAIQPDAIPLIGRIITKLSPGTFEANLEQILKAYSLDGRLREPPLPKVSVKQACYISETHALRTCEVLTQFCPDFNFSKPILEDAMAMWGFSLDGPRGFSPELVQLIITFDTYDSFIAYARKNDFQVVHGIKPDEGYRLIPNLEDFRTRRYNCIKKVVHYCILGFNNH